MGSITVRKLKDGSAAYTAQIRIMQKGVTVYQESQAIDRKTVVGTARAARVSQNACKRLRR